MIMKDLNRVENIVVISLSRGFCKGVALSLSSKLDMFNIDAKDMVTYDLINPKEVLEKCGVSYLKKRERGVIEGISGYLDCVISINFDLFKDNIDLFEKSLICYLALPLASVEGTINQLDYDFRDEFLTKNSDIIIHLDKKSKKSAVAGILDKLKGE